MSQDIAAPGRGKLPAELVLLVLTLIWGGTFLVIKIGLAHGGALGLVGLRFALGVVLLARITHPSWPSLREWRAGGLIGAALFAGYALQAQGLTSIASSRSAFFTALYIPLVPLLQWLFQGKRPGWTGLAGIALAFTGLVLLAHPSGLSLHLSLGDRLTLACALACAIEILLLSRYAPDCNPRRLAIAQMSVVAILSLLASLITKTAPPWHYPPFWFATLALGAATSLTMLGQAWGQARVSALRATLIYALEPVWAGGVGALAGDPMDAATLKRAGLILAGILVESLKRFGQGGGLAPRRLLASLSRRRGDV